MKMGVFRLEFSNTFLNSVCILAAIVMEWLCCYCLNF